MLIDAGLLEELSAIKESGSGTGLVEEPCWFLVVGSAILEDSPVSLERLIEGSSWTWVVGCEDEAGSLLG